MKTKFYLTIVIIGVMNFNSSAQDSIPQTPENIMQDTIPQIPGGPGLKRERKNISKTNLLFAPLFKTAEVIQERKLSKRITMQTIAKTRIPSSLDGSRFATVNADGTSYNPFGQAKLSGVGNITEFRLYGKKKGAFKGLYAGLFFSYMHYKLSTQPTAQQFTDDQGVVYKGDVSYAIKINNTGGGIEWGVQGLIKDMICIDWTIIGLGMSSLGVQGSIDATNTSENFDFRNYGSDLDKVTLGADKLVPFRKSINKTSMSLGAKAPFLLFRMGLSIGFAY